MSNRHRISLGAVALIAAVGLTGCGAGSNELIPPVSGDQRRTMEASNVFDANTPADITSRATTLVLIEPVAGRVITRFGDEDYWSEYTAKVVENIAGVEMPDEITIYQAGRPGWHLSVRVPKFLDSEQYLVLLNPAGAELTDGYFITDVGAWKAEGNGDFTMWVTDEVNEEVGRDVPRTITREDAAQRLHAELLGTVEP